MLFALRHWKLLLGGFVLLSLAATATYYRLDRDHWRAVAKTLRIDLDRVQVATELADQKARAAKLAQEAEYREKAERTDDAYKANLADARARAADYARRMRVQAPGSASGGPAAPADSGGAQGADGPGEGSGVVVTREDFDTLTENTIRLQAAREWACSLEGAGCD